MKNKLIDKTNPDFSVSKIKNNIKNILKKLKSYSTGEENYLIEECLGYASSDLILKKEFTKKEIKKLQKVLNKRLTEKPLNKIFKKSYFYLDDFFISDFVLAPRKETEILVEETLKIIHNKYLENKNYKLKVLDLCCGSGAIGLSLAKHSSTDIDTYLSDISNKAIKITKKNQKRLNLISKTTIIKSDLFEHLKIYKPFDIIVCNPPYIETKKIEKLDKSVRLHDPKISLDGGKDGLYFYKEIAKNCKYFLNKNGVILLEIGYNQNKKVSDIFNNFNFETFCLKDYSGNDRIIIAKNKEVKDIS